MSRKRLKALTLEEVIELLEDIPNKENEIEGADVVMIPPDSHCLTDEDETSDNESGESTVNDIPGPFELHAKDNQIEHDEVSSQINPPQGAKKRKKPRSYEPLWSKTHPEYTKSFARTEGYSEAFTKMKNALQHCSPLEIFHEIITPEIYDYILKSSNRYCASSDIFSVDELKAFFGVIMFSSYCKLPTTRNYWSDDEDLGQSIVRNAMTLDRFQHIRSIIHFCNDEELEDNKSDKGYEIRALIQLVRKSFRKYGIFEKNLSVDEMIIKYHGHNRLKQFIKGKPVRFGYKFWALCGSSGYCYNFDLYCGKSHQEGTNDDLSLGSRVVHRMLEIVADPRSHCVFLDDLFTSHGLLIHLRNEGYEATGTMRENRLKKCPLKEQTQLKKETRGSYDYNFDVNNEILIVRWLDNQCVTIGTNYDAVEPITNVFRWNKRENARGPVMQPHVLKTYSMCMGGVDKHDRLVSKYASSIRGKKWYWPLFTRILDMAVVNAWTIYKLIHDGNGEIKTLLHFKRYICTAYLKGSTTTQSAARTNLATSNGLINDVRFDLTGHVIGKRDKQRRCQNKFCNGKPRTYCQKCDVTLCVKCFAPYHKV